MVVCNRLQKTVGLNDFITIYMPRNGIQWQADISIIILVLQITAPTSNFRARPRPWHCILWPCWHHCLLPIRYTQLCTSCLIGGDIYCYYITFRCLLVIRWPGSRWWTISVTLPCNSGSFTRLLKTAHFTMYYTSSQINKTPSSCQYFCQILTDFQKNTFYQYT